jgi:hypothetical protein
VEQAPNSNPEDTSRPDDYRKGYTFPPHPSGSRWDLTPDGYEGEDGLAYFADGTLDRDAMMEPEYRDFGVDIRTVHRRYLEWAEMADEIREQQNNPADPPEPSSSSDL